MSHDVGAYLVNIAMKRYKRLVLFGIFLIVLGIVFSSTMEGSYGIVIFAVGGLFFIAGVSKKQKEDQDNK